MINFNEQSVKESDDLMNFKRFNQLIRKVSFYAEKIVGEMDPHKFYNFIHKMLKGAFGAVTKTKMAKLFDEFFEIN